MPIRVLHVISSPDSRRGGPQYGLMGLIPAQQACGTHVELFSSWQAGENFDMQARLAPLGVQVTLAGPTRGPLTGRSVLRPALSRCILASDVVHIHGIWEEVQHQAARIAWQAGVPYIIAPHGMLDPWSLSQKRLKKRLYLFLRLGRHLRRAAAIHYMTQQERRLAAPWTAANAAIVEPPGINLDEFDPTTSGEPFRKAFPAIGDRQIVLFLSRLHPKKGLDLLIPAMASFRGEPVVLAIVGPGDEAYVAKLRRLVAQHQLDSQVIFTGMVDDRLRVCALAAAELMVLSSYQENFGLAVVEALAMGRPVVVSDQVQIQEEIEPAGVGSVVSLDVARLSGEIRRWLSDATLRREAGRRARALVETRFTWPPIGAHWREHYQRLAESARRGRPPADGALPSGGDSADRRPGGPSELKIGP